MATFLPHLNAFLNAISAILLTTAWFAIRQKKVARHRACMVSAFGCSILFLISYLIRFYLTGTHRYPGTGWDRTLYLTILLTHMPLAALVPPLAIRSMYLAVKKRFVTHRQWARVTLPIWLYVSVTGVVIYWMLYH